MFVNVKNGTRAGWRRVKAAGSRDWRCPGCGAKCRYYWTRCPNCGHPRPQEG